MPSLKALEEFQASFRNIGGENLALAEQNLSPENYPLPDHEPVVRQPPPPPAGEEGEDSLTGSDEFPEDFTGDEAEEGGTGLPGLGSLGDLLGAGSGIMSSPVPEIPEDFGEPGEVPEETEKDGFSLPDDLLNGLADELESTSPAEEQDTEDFSPPDYDAESSTGDPGSSDDFSLDSLEFPDFDDEAPGTGEAAPSTEDTEDTEDTGDFPLDDLNLPDFDETGGAEEEMPLPGENAGDGADSFEGFNPEGNELPADSGLDSSEDAAAGDGAGTGGAEEFSLEGFEDILNRAASSGTAKPAVSVQPSSSSIKAAEEVEEIRLDEDELADLQNTLSSYPLNLRIACEELIAEQAVDPSLMSKLVKLLVQGASARETAALASKILERPIAIPRGFERKTGEALEAERSSFAYLFVHNFLPVLRLFLLISIAGLSLVYLVWQFIYTPLKAESIYKRGYERIGTGDYGRANDLFREAFRIRRVKDWFYRYAEAFRDERQYILAEEKYDELLRYYPRDKKGVLDYANLETNYRFNYQKADDLLRRQILDYAVDDPDALLALGDNNLAWGALDPSRYEDARAAYAKLMERYGRTDPVLERMLKYFIRVDDLWEVLSLQAHFMVSPKTKISPATLAEMGGYLLDKRFEDTQGVPHEFQARIEGIREILLRAVKADPSYPESHYHLARYYNHWGNTGDERITLEWAIRCFDAAREEPVQRIKYRIDTQLRYAQLLTNNREFFPAEVQLAKGIGLYEDALNRGILPRTPEFGQLYADLGDLEFFVKDGQMESALQYYSRAEQNGWAPPEMQYRMGAAHYQMQQWLPALERFFAVSSEMPLNRRLLHALGNASFQRGDYFNAQGYYSRLLDLLESERARFPLLDPQAQPEHMELAERLMAARNNLGVTLEVLSDRTGNPAYRVQALALFAESNRAWDALTRNPSTMIRAGAGELSSPGMSLPYLNSRNSLYPERAYEPAIFVYVDKDVLEPSPWEDLVPGQGSRLSDNIDLSSSIFVPGVP